jgi:hypothetical protein
LTISAEVISGGEADAIARVTRNVDHVREILKFSWKTLSSAE